MLKLRYALKDKFNEQLNFNQLTFDESDFIFNVSSDQLTVTGADLTDEEKGLLLGRLRSRVENFKDVASKGQVDSFG